MEKGRGSLKRVDVASVLITNPTDDTVLTVKKIDREPWSVTGGEVEEGERLAAAAAREG
jgi:ADP-ribose pyrophosphatase YjhB (NUDIX family)